MKKQKTTLFRCSACGHEEAKWLGRCPDCGEWNTLQETSIRSTTLPVSGSRQNSMPARSLPLSSVDPDEGKRLSSGIGELDRVLGGGIMKHSAILVGGEPGIGKSTLLLQAAAAARTKGRILYVSGEESAGQIKMRADRLNLDAGRIEVFCSGRLEDIDNVLRTVNPVLLIVDSVQTLFSPELGMVPGTINQMKYCSHELISWAKDHDAAVFLVAHVTKDGSISGPKSLEHMVDTVLYFEQNDADSRFLRAAKNRFGSVDEIGIFTMGERGLQTVEDPSRLFLVSRNEELPAGIVTAAVLEGSRTLLVEIQALVVPAKGNISRVFSDRIDTGKVSRIAAILEKHLKLRLSDHDLYVNVAGGIRINEVGVELALAAALHSARTGIALPADSIIAGELSLAGEVRPIRRLNNRVKAAKNLGFARFIGPNTDRTRSEFPEKTQQSEEWTRVRNLKEAIEALLKTTKD